MKSFKPLFFVIGIFLLFGSCGHVEKTGFDWSVPIAVISGFIVLGYSIWPKQKMYAVQIKDY